MIELAIWEAIVWGAIIVSLASFVIVPLSVRYLTPNPTKKEK